MRMQRSPPRFKSCPRETFLPLSATAGVVPDETTEGLRFFSADRWVRGRMVVGVRA